MGAFDDVEASRPRSPTLNMMGRGPGDSRRRLMLLILLGGFLLVSLVAFRKHDDIGDMIETQTHAWSNSNATYLKPAEKEVEKPAAASKEDAGQATKKKPAPPSKEDAENGTKDIKAATDDIVGKADKATKTPEKPIKPSTETKPVLPGPKLGDRKLSDSSLIGVRNQTLGFEQVYVLNMAGRTDKLDAMRLTASLSGFNFEINEGVSGKDVPEKALSGVFDDDNGGKDGVIGCWRGHMNFAHTILQKQHATALIMEDDADWDVDFRSQLEAFALGSQTLLDTSRTSDPASPYGDGWDLLWLGHCASQPNDGDYRRVVMKNDPTVTPPNHRVNFGGVPDMSPYDNTTRIMYFSKGSTCTYAYALSYHGAQKVLKWLSMDVYNKPVDFGLHDMCSEKARGFKCIGIFPQIVADHKPPGGANKDSDINKGDGEASKVRKKGFSYNIVRSTRLNVDVLIDGKKEKATPQWPEDYTKLEGPVQMELTNNPVPDTAD